MQGIWAARDSVFLIGHLTRDRIHVAGRSVSMPGGAVHYAGVAYARLGADVSVFTKLAREDADELTQPLRTGGCRVHVAASRATTEFENTLTEDLRARTQRVQSLADAFDESDLAADKSAIAQLGPLTNREMDADFVEHVARSSRALVLDIQGFVRESRSGEVVPAAWPEAERILALCQVVKADADEAFVVTGEREPERAARALQDLGAREVLLTLAENGSYVASADGVSFIPARPAPRTIDSTAAGDTYTAGYVFARKSGQSVLDSARFATALASLSIAAAGPFSGTLDDVTAYLKSA